LFLIAQIHLSLSCSAALCSTLSNSNRRLQPCLPHPLSSFPVLPVVVLPKMLIPPLEPPAFQALRPVLVALLDWLKGECGIFDRGKNKHYGVDFGQ